MRAGQGSAIRQVSSLATMPANHVEQSSTTLLCPFRSGHVMLSKKTLMPGASVRCRPDTDTSPLYSFGKVWTA